FAPDSLRPDDLALGGVNASHEAFLGRGVNEATNEKRGSVFADVRLELPRHMRVGDIALAAWSNGPQLCLRQTGNKIDVSLVAKWSWSDGPIGILHLPKLPTGARVVGIGRLGAGAEHLGAPCDRGDQRRAVGLAQIPIPRHRSWHVFVVPDDGSIGLPNRPAGLLVERDMVLHVNSVEGQDDQVFEQDN